MTFVVSQLMCVQESRTAKEARMAWMSSPGMVDEAGRVEEPIPSAEGQLDVAAI